MYSFEVRFVADVRSMTSHCLWMVQLLAQAISAVPLLLKILMSLP
jgi:hypothetical protein